MSRIPFTQARVERAVKAARKLGLRVKCIRPDGSVEVEEQDAPVLAGTGHSHLQNRPLMVNGVLTPA